MNKVRLSSHFIQVFFNFSQQCVIVFTYRSQTFFDRSPPFITHFLMLFQMVFLKFQFLIAFVLVLLFTFYILWYIDIFRPRTPGEGLPLSELAIYQKQQETCLHAHQQILSPYPHLLPHIRLLHSGLLFFSPKLFQGHVQTTRDHLYNPVALHDIVCLLLLRTVSLKLSFQ